jgi:endonuclease YncB( thermonuclease family)
MAVAGWRGGAKICSRGWPSKVAAGKIGHCALELCDLVDGCRGSVVMATRIDPGIAVLAVVAGLTGALLILQSVNHKSAATAPAPALPVDKSLPPVAQTPSTPTPARTPPTQPLSGIARVIDGDTIEVRGTHVRLDGIDAPESKQTCEANGQTYPCGKQATEALIILLGARPVECTETGKDQHQRIIAKCRVDSTDLGKWMVEHGWAVAFRKYSSDYVSAEDRARMAKLGIWAGTFEMPENWRRQKAIQGMERAMERTHVQQ